ncbi:hypothetical protein C0995_002438 [Termitomyces sp. Mi166|nr:hypothetical protein C0995_002438 [Termitomyces sp. Mi166\
MFAKISLLKVSAGASLLEHEHTAQDFVIAANDIFYKAQGLATLVPLHKTVFGLLEGLLDNWCVLGLDSMEWRQKAEVCQLHSELSLQEQKEVCAMGSLSNRLLLAARVRQRQRQQKKMMTNEDEGTQTLREELKNFVVPTKGCLWNGVGIRIQKKYPPMEVLLLAKHVKLVWAAKAFLEHQGKLLQAFVLEGFKKKGKAKALIADLEQTGTKRAFKSRETVDSNNDEEEKEERIHMIKKIKCEHVEEPIGMSKGKKSMELQMTVGGTFTFNFKAHVSNSAPKIIAAAPVPKHVPVTSTGKPAIKGGSVIKNPFMVKQFKLAGTEESGVLIINQVTEVSAGKVTSAATQETLQSKEDTGNEDNNDKGNNNNKGNDDNNATMDVNTGSLVVDAKFLELLHLEET